MKLHEITIAEEAVRCLLCYDAPCSKACPAASDPAAFIMAVRFDNRSGGARKTLDGNLFGGVCAAACPSEKYCEGACIRGKIDSPVNIRMLHSAVTQYADENGIGPALPDLAQRGAALILGANLSALTAASELAKAGIKADIFPNGPIFGTWLSGGAGIEPEILDNAFQRVIALGVSFLAEKPSGGFAGYDAVIVSTKKSLAQLPPEETSGMFFTGELASGPADAPYCVKKGKDAAARVLEFLKEVGK